MSWSIFRNNVLRVMQNQSSIQNADQIARLLAKEYDLAVKRGRDLLNGVSLANGNVTVAESFFNVAFKRGLLDFNGTFSLTSELGRGVVAYWQGARMSQIPIPLIPAIGSIQNIQVNQNIVANPGIFPTYPPIKPTKSVEMFVDQFILASIIHLLTVSGVIQTTSLYPSVPTPVPALGVIFWRAYIVGLPTVGLPDSDSNTTNDELFATNTRNIINSTFANTNPITSYASNVEGLIIGSKNAMSIVNEVLPSEVFENLNVEADTKAMVEFANAEIIRCAPQL